MSSDESGLGQNARYAIGALAFFGVAILVTLAVTSGPETADTVASDEQSGSANIGALDEQQGVWCNIDRDTLDGEDQEASQRASDILKVLRQQVEFRDECIAEGETVMVVQGLPQVSGVYWSREPSLPQGIRAKMRLWQFEMLFHHTHSGLSDVGGHQL